jgi:hypothetical protein
MFFSDYVYTRWKCPVTLRLWPQVYYLLCSVLLAHITSSAVEVKASSLSEVSWFSRELQYFLSSQNISQTPTMDFASEAVVGVTLGFIESLLVL